MGCHIIPEGLEDEDVLFVGDILSTGYFGAENGRIQPGDTVLVSGCGPVGMCAMATARLWGPKKIIAFDINQDRLDFAVANGYADVALNPLHQDALAEILEMTDGRGADVCIEAVGTTPTFNMAINAVRPGGNVSVIGVFEGPVELAMNKLWIKNITISMGLVNSNHIPELIGLIKEGRINMRPLQTHRKPLNDILEGYDIFGGKKDNCIKWVVTPYER